MGRGREKRKVYKLINTFYIMGEKMKNIIAPILIIGLLIIGTISVSAFICYIPEQPKYKRFRPIPWKPINFIPWKPINRWKQTLTIPEDFKNANIVIGTNLTDYRPPIYIYLPEPIPLLPIYISLPPMTNKT